MGLVLLSALICDREITKEKGEKDREREREWERERSLLLSTYKVYNGPLTMQTELAVIDYDKSQRKHNKISDLLR